MKRLTEHHEKHGKGLLTGEEMRYTTIDMQNFFNNRYARLALLTLGIGALLYLVIWLIASMAGLDNLSPFLIFMLSALGAGLTVYKLFAQRVY